MIPDNPKGISKLRFWGKNCRINGISELAAFMQQRPSFVTEEPWERFYDKMAACRALRLDAPWPLSVRIRHRFPGQDARLQHLVSRRRRRVKKNEDE